MSEKIESGGKLDGTWVNGVFKLIIKRRHLKTIACKHGDCMVDKYKKSAAIRDIGNNRIRKITVMRNGG